VLHCVALWGGKDSQAQLIMNCSVLQCVSVLHVGWPGFAGMINDELQRVALCCMLGVMDSQEQ